MKFEQQNTAPAKRSIESSPTPETEVPSVLRTEYENFLRARDTKHATAVGLAFKRFLSDYRAENQARFVQKYKMLEGKSDEQRVLRLCHQEDLDEIRFYERKSEGEKNGPLEYVPSNAVAEPTAVSLTPEEIQKRTADWVEGAQRDLETSQKGNEVIYGRKELERQFDEAKRDAAPELFAASIKRGDLSIAYDQYKMVADTPVGLAMKGELSKLLEEKRQTIELAFVANYRALADDSIKQKIARQTYARQLDFLNFYHKKLEGDTAGPDHFQLNEEELARLTFESKALIVTEPSKSVEMMKHFQQAQREILPTAMARARATKDYMAMADQLEIAHKVAPEQYQAYKAQVLDTITHEIARATKPRLLARVVNVLTGGVDATAEVKVLQDMKASVENDHFLQNNG